MVNILLIRHAETIHNLAGRWAGRLDSPLTAHGAVQATLLAQHLSTHFAHVTHVFVSPLSRTQHTAAALLSALAPPPPTVVTTPLIIERDFGSVDGMPHSVRPDPNSVERLDDVAMRADNFLDEYLIPAVQDAPDATDTLVVVSHGGFLPELWERLAERFAAGVIKGRDEMEAKARGGRPRWVNTAWLWIRVDGDRDELEVVDGLGPRSAHLEGLKRTPGGVGSAEFDQSQMGIGTFFVKKESAGGAGKI